MWPPRRRPRFGGSGAKRERAVTGHAGHADSVRRAGLAYFRRLITLATRLVSPVWIAYTTPFSV